MSDTWETQRLRTDPFPGACYHRQRMHEPLSTSVERRWMHDGESVCHKPLGSTYTDNVQIVDDTIKHGTKQVHTHKQILHCSLLLCTASDQYSYFCTKGKADSYRQVIPYFTVVASTLAKQKVIPSVLLRNLLTPGTKYDLFAPTMCAVISNCCPPKFPVNHCPRSYYILPFRTRLSEDSM